MTKDLGLCVAKILNSTHGVTTAGQDILKKRLERGDIEEEGVLYTKRGYNK